MGDILFLDALNPGPPAQLVADMRQVGASAVGLYVLRRDGAGGLLTNGTWTAEHVQAVLAEGWFVLPIVVPGNNPLPSDILSALTAARDIGCPVGPIAVDLETFSFPPGLWVGAFIVAARTQGWRVLRYGDVAALAGYPSGDGDWISHGYIPVRENALLPVPALPNEAGVVADQYTVGVVLNGTSYDGSVFSLDVFPAGGVDVLPMGFKIGLAKTAIKAAYGRFPSQQEQTDFANALNDDGSNYNELCDELMANAGHPDGVRLQNTTLADEVDALKGIPPGSLPPHTHEVTTSGTAGAPRATG